MELNFSSLVIAFLAIGVRVSGLLLFAPFFGSTAIPIRIKAILALTITTVLFPAYEKRLLTTEIAHWPFLILAEFALGIALGIATNLVFDAVQLAGQVLSIQMGYSLVNILDPQTQVESTVVALFHQTIALLVFLSLDVHHYLLRAIANSFEYLPPGSAHLNMMFATGVFKVGASVFEVGIQIAAPVLSATLAIDVVIGFLGKASTQMPLMLLGPAIKSMLGLVILMGVLKYWPHLYEKWFSTSLFWGEHLLHLAR